MINKFIVLFIVLGISKSFAETINCKGKTDTDHDFELTINMSKKKSTIRFFYGKNPAEGSVLQGLDLHGKRIFKSPTILSYGGVFNSTNSYLEIKLDENNKILSSKFNKPLSGFVNTPIECSVTGSFPEAPICDAYANELLITAVKNNDIDEMEWQLACGANVNYKNKIGCTPLLTAFDAGCGMKNSISSGPSGGAFSQVNVIADLLIENGAYVDLVDPINNQTALIKAARFGLQNVYDNFIASEANFDFQDNLGNTALMYAVLNNDVFLVKDILNGNPDRRIKNKAGETAFDIAKHWEKNSVINLVKIPDVTIEIKGNEDGTCTPLIIELNQNQIVEFALTATDKMFKFESEDLNIDLMADRNATSRQVIASDEKGHYKFSCGFHGGSNSSQGEIIIK